MEQQVARLTQQHDLILLLLTLVVVFLVIQLAALGFVSAWAVHVITDNQKRMEREWTQVLQILAHARAEDRRKDG